MNKIRNIISMKRKQYRVFIFIMLVSFVVVFTGCKGDNSGEVVSVTVTPADSTVSQTVGFVQFVATATYGDNSTGDISSDVEWKSNNLLAASVTDLLFDSPSSSLAILRSTGTFVIQATYQQYSASTTSDTSVVGLTTITIN